MSSPTWQTRPVHTALAVVTAHYGMKRADLVGRRPGKRGPRTITGARQLVMWLACRLGAGFAHTAHYLGCDHTTVIHGVAKVDAKIAASPELGELCDSLLASAQAISRKLPRLAGYPSENAVAAGEPQCTVRSSAP